MALTLYARTAERAATATNNPNFNYVLPALGAVLGVLLMWLVVSWLLHLV